MESAYHYGHEPSHVHWPSYEPHDPHSHGLIEKMHMPFFDEMDVGYQQPQAFAVLPAAPVPAFSSHFFEQYRNDDMMLDEATATSPRSPEGTPREHVEVKLEPRHSASLVKMEWREIDQMQEDESNSARRVQCFVCPVPSCQRPYRRKGDLKVHVKKKHPDHIDLPDLISRPRSTKANKPFPCPIDGCPCGFLRYRGLQRHFRKKHPAHAGAPTPTGSSGHPSANQFAPNTGFFYNDANEPDIVSDDEEDDLSHSRTPLKLDSDSYSDA